MFELKNRNLWSWIYLRKSSMSTWIRVARRIEYCMEALYSIQYKSCTPLLRHAIKMRNGVCVVCVCFLFKANFTRGLDYSEQNHLVQEKWQENDRFVFGNNNCKFGWWQIQSEMIRDWRLSRLSTQLGKYCALYSSHSSTEQNTGGRSCYFSRNYSLSGTKMTHCSHVIESLSNYICCLRIILICPCPEDFERGTF